MGHMGSPPGRLLLGSLGLKGESVGRCSGFRV